MAISSKVKFFPNSQDDFGNVLKERVDAYFTERGLSKKANLEMVFKSVFYLGGFLGCYFVIIFAGLPAMGALGIAMLLGLFIAGMGFNIGHDALHGAYSNRKWVNELMGHSYSIMGANTYTWNVIHNIVHHSYTNIPEADGDLQSVQALRFFKEKPRALYHRYQHWYALFLYCFTSLVWVFRKDYVHINKKQHMIYQKPPTPRSEVIALILTKAAYYIAFIAVPILFTEYLWWQVAVGFLAMHFVSGFALALTFQLGHLVEGTEFPHLSEGGFVPDTFFVHQLKTSANFSTKGYLASFIFGGLNFQIEHHLFPKICHVHYRHLSPIVEKTAHEFGLPYNAYPSFLSSVASHIRYLKQTGQAA